MFRHFFLIYLLRSSVKDLDPQDPYFLGPAVSESGSLQNFLFLHCLFLTYVIINLVFCSYVLKNLLGVRC
jgi:hypothetical protein